MKGSKFHMLEIVVGNNLFLTNIKQKNLYIKIFLILALLNIFYYYQKCKTEISINLCTKLACYNENLQFLKTNLL